jgi:hypothetical protein
VGYGQKKKNKEPRSKFLGIEDFTLKFLPLWGNISPTPPVAAASCGVLNQMLRNKLPGIQSGSKTMETDFIKIVQQVVAEQGKGALVNPVKRAEISVRANAKAEMERSVAEKTASAPPTRAKSSAGNTGKSIAKENVLAIEAYKKVSSGGLDSAIYEEFETAGNLKSETAVKEEKGV